MSDGKNMVLERQGIEYAVAGDELTIRQWGQCLARRNVAQRRLETSCLRSSVLGGIV